MNWVGLAGNVFLVGYRELVLEAVDIELWVVE
jgi:hypothetical protein